jgi:hypothetical protein
LAGTLIEVGIGDIGVESLMPRFVSSCDRGFCDLGMEEEEDMKCAELGT